MKNKKIYLLEYEDKFGEVGTYKYCSTIEIAEKEKQRLEQKIQNIKTLYYLEYNNDYDEDYRTVRKAGFVKNPFPENYEELRNRVYIFEFENEEVSYTDIFIKEEELL